MAELLKALSIGEIKSKFRVRLDKVVIENRAFRLFSRVTVGCLFVCAGLVSLQQLVGKHIECIVPPKEDIRPGALDQYCFIMGTYTVPELYNLTVGIDIAHPGVGTFHFDDEEESKQQYHTWYQWVPIALFFQGMTFLLPHMLWKAFEKEKIKAYCDLEVASKINLKVRSLNDNSDPEKKRNTISKAAVYFVGTMSYNNFYAYAYVFCEILNILILAFNFYFTDVFLGGGDFANYGPEVVAFSKLEDTEGLISPMDRIFPKVSKCDFHKYGPSGGLIRYDIMCILAINIINEKIYVFLWFWFIILFCLGLLAVLYRVAVFAFPGIRNLLIRRRTDPRYRDALNYVLRGMSYPDWFVLRKLNDNINTIRFGELVQGIKAELMKKSPEGRLSSSPLPAYAESDKSYKDTDEDGDVMTNLVNKDIV
ncbi:unnamed protein product [Orchesella dallaii]|uniref:Innexin n=1 Tax=Orchesella dallaii TaxID=48710 RepID=A0ABP1RXH7_9HEXA